MDIKGISLALFTPIGLYDGAKLGLAALASVSKIGPAANTNDQYVKIDSEHECRIDASPFGTMCRHINDGIWRVFDFRHSPAADKGSNECRRSLYLK